MKTKTTVTLNVGERSVGSITVIRETESKKPLIPPELQDAYGSVEAEITARLAIISSQSVGEMPFAYGEMGGKNPAQDALEELKKRRINDDKIARNYLKNQGVENIKGDPDILARVRTAINAIRGSTPINKEYSGFGRAVKKIQKR